MQDPENEYIGEFLELLNKLNVEADKLNKHVETVRKKGGNAVRKAESVVSVNMKQNIREQAKQAIIQMIEHLVEINCHLELADDELPNLKIPDTPSEGGPIKLKFLAGDNPWNFWLVDEKVDTKTLHKNLLIKYQSNLLEPYPNPKPSESVCFLDRSKVFRGIVLQSINENRVKVLDCDSNISKVIMSEKVFKADPDACHVHASAIKCTIAKESVGADIWNSDLRDMFCNALKEAVLRVRMLEKLAGSFPRFLVDVEMKNEEEDCVGNLQEWILNRLLPELKKLTTDENESVYDFLSSEALNPYQNGNLEVIPTVMDTNKSQTRAAESRASLSEEDNNLNSDTNKVSVKIVSNMNDAGDKKTDSESLMFSSSSEELVTSRNSAAEIFPKSKSSEPVLDKQLNHSVDFRPIRPDRSVAVRFNQVVPSRGVFVHQPPPSNFPHGYGPQFPLGYGQMQIQPIHPSASRWTFHGANLQSNYPLYPPPLGVYQQWPQPSSPQAASQSVLAPLGNKGDTAAISNSNVNVMAPVFFPKANNDVSQMTSKIHSSNSSASPVIPANDKIIQVELRNPRSLLKPDDNLLVMISHIVSPAEFYVHFITNNNKYLDKLNEDMFTHYNNIDKVSFNSWLEAKSVLGKFCACKWLEDNHWYRVEVLDWCLRDGKVKVNFVDHGNVDIVPLDCVQPLAQQFTKLSMCAQPCHLAKVLPSRKHEVWSEESIQFFKSKVEVTNSRVYSVTVVPSKEKEGKNNSLSVLLYEGKATEDCLSVNEQMVAGGLAWSKPFSKLTPSSDSEIYQSHDELSSQYSDATNTSSDKLTKPRQGIPQSGQVTPEVENGWETWDPMTEEYKSVRNNPARDTDDPGVALIGYSAKDESRICHLYSKRGFCPKVLCTQEHSLPSRDGVTRDKEEVFCRAFSEMALPSVGESVEVLVTAVASINLFYVQLPQIRALDIRSDDEEEETLTSLAEFMNETENVQQMKYLKVPPAVGQLVLAKWDDQWYRARVISCDEEFLEVMYVDYGSLSTVSELNLREMEPRYLHLPFQAVECSLANIIPPKQSTENYEKATETLRELVEGKQFEAKVYDSGDTEEVQRLQVVLQLGAGIDVGEWIANNNLCSLRQ